MKKWGYETWRKIDGNGKYHIKWSDPSSERQTPHFLPCRSLVLISRNVLEQIWIEVRKLKRPTWREWRSFHGARGGKDNTAMWHESERHVLKLEDFKWEWGQDPWEGQAGTGPIIQN